MPITRVKSKHKHLKVIRDTNLPYVNQSPQEEQFKQNNRRVIISNTRPFWKRWLTLLKNYFA